VAVAEHQISNFSAVCHFQQYFSYIVAVSFIGGENQRAVASR
jgi:hypothetical protein